MSLHGSQTGLNRRLSDRHISHGDFSARSDGHAEGFPPLHQQYLGAAGPPLAGTQMYGTVGGRGESQTTISKHRSLYSPRSSRTYDVVEQSQHFGGMDLLKKHYDINFGLTESCAFKLSEAEKMLQQDLNAFDHGQLGRYRHQIDGLLRGAGDDLVNIEENIDDLQRNGYPTEALQNRVFHLRSQMRFIAKTISDRWTERSKSMYNINQRHTDSWDEGLSRSTNELFGWIKQQKLLLDSQEWGVDASSVEQQMNNHKRYHKSLEEARWKIDKIKAEQYDNHSSNYRDAIEAIESEYESMLKASGDRFDQLRKFQDIIQATSNEIMWINDREEEELVFDWSDKNTNMAQKQETFSVLMSQLEEKEKQLNRLKQEGDQLVANNHPASDKIEAYIDTLQTQWSWILQLTKCIEVHLKENSNYFQFFEDAQVTENSLKKMQDSLRKKYVSDRSTSLQQLEKMITESEKDKEKILEYKRQVSNLVNKSKKIVQLKPRNPSTGIDQRGPNQIILKALCDYKQDQRVIHRGNECILLDNSQRSKWRVIGPGGMEMVVPSICLLIPPPNPGAIDLANKIDQYYEAILSLWNQLYINMKSLISWQYCMIDIEKIQSWTISVVSSCLCIFWKLLFSKDEV